MKNTATATAINLLTSLMKNGKMDLATAEKVLRENHACRVATLARSGLVVVGVNTVKTPERHEADLEKLRKQEERKALKAQLAKLEKALKALQ